MRKIAFFLSIILLSASRFADVNEIKITGKIISNEDGSGLPGVNVIEKGTSNGTVSDLNGKYNLSVKNESSVLVFSAVGFLTEEITPKSRRVINIMLKADISALEEVVVTGYARKKLFSRSSREAKAAMDKIGRAHV